MALLLAVAQRGQHRGDLAGPAVGDVDVAALEHAAGKVGLVGVALAQPIDRGLPVPEGGEELERELGPVTG
ncbi:hypothetical protein [Hoeflea sp.]|uniref:hypothetical protein n=1 Tax=Hoeflea sp. TaxID=1940281 RepID=UPI00199790FC|nr:hypothetical protein [Hoeflea sp.]MBC7281948.1 hypothetical protein [Hoeflea sp.]